MRTRDETLGERLKAGALTGGIMGTMLGGVSGAAQLPKHLIENGAEASALLKFIIKHAGRTGAMALGGAAVTPIASALLHGIKPRKVVIE